MTEQEQLATFSKRVYLDNARLEKQGLTRLDLSLNSDDSRQLLIYLNWLRDAMYTIPVAKKALAFYGDTRNYEELPLNTNVGQDGGMMARVALATIDPV